MPGFPFAAIGAGLGQWAQQAQQQQAQRERNQMLMMTLQRFQQEMQDRQQERASAEGLWGSIGGGGAGIKPVDPMGGGGGVGVPLRAPLPAAASAPDFGAAGEYGGGQGPPAASGVDPFTTRLMALGVLPEVAGGVVDYMRRNESNLDPGATNPKSGALGVAQWLGPRKAMLTSQYGERPSADQQAAFMGGELQGSEAATLSKLRGAKTADEGYRIWGQSYERPSPAELSVALSRGPSGGTRPIQVADAGGLAPGFARGPDGGLTRNGQPPDTYIGGLRGPGGGATPAWREDQQVADAGPTPAAPAAPAPPLAIPDLRKRLNAIIPPDVNGRMSAAALKAKIDEACPTCPAVYKVKYLDSELKRLAPMEAERVRAEHDRYKTQIDAETKMWEEEVKRQDRTETGGAIITGPGGEQYSVQGRTARPITIEGTREQLKDATRLSGTGGSTASAGREKDVVGEIKRLDDAYTAANPNATKAEKDAAHFNNRKAAEKALTTAKTSEGRNPAAMYMRKYLEQNPEATPADISRASASFVRDQSIERNFAGGSGATQMRSLNTVADHLSLMREYASALKTGDIPRINQLQQLLSKETGWPEVTNFNVARDIMADEVVRLLTSTGGTEADRAGMQARFAAAMSPDQMHGALEAAERFVAGRFKGLEQNYARNDPVRRREFEQEMLTPEARNTFTKYGQQPGGAPATQPTHDSPAGGPQEGQTATNPRTGAKLIFRGGKWDPTQ